MKKTILASILALSSITTFAQIDQVAPQPSVWTVVSSSKGGNEIYAVRNGSFTLTKNNSGEVIFGVIGRKSLISEKTSEVYKWYVTPRGCLEEAGMITVLDITGKYLYNSGFVFGQGTVGADVAETICSVATLVLKDKKPVSGKAV